MMEGNRVGAGTDDFLPLSYSGRPIILPRMGPGGSPFLVTLQHLHIPSFLLDSWFPSSQFNKRYICVYVCIYFLVRVTWFVL